MGLSYTCFVYFSFIYILLISVFSACAHDDMQVSQGMVGQSAARRAAGIILEMVKVSLMWVCVRGRSLVLCLITFIGKLFYVRTNCQHHALSLYMLLSRRER